MVEHSITTSKTPLFSEHVVTDDESSSSEGASEGGTDDHDGYDPDKELLISDQEGVISSKLSPHSTHTNACEQVHDCLQPHADNTKYSMLSPHKPTY